MDLIHFSLARFCVQRISYFTSISLFFFAFSVHAQENTLNVNVITSHENISQHKLTFEGKPRLFEVIERGAGIVRETWRENQSQVHRENTNLQHNSDPIFWGGAGLFSNVRDNNAIRILEGETREKLRALSREWERESEKREAVLSLLAFIENSSFKPRLFLTLDLDTFLTGNNGKEWLNTNPLLGEDLILLLPSRLPYVWVLGAVKSSQQVSFSPMKQTHAYIDEAQTLYWFGSSTVSVIQPDGHLENHAVAYWNKAPNNVAPGGMVFVPFKGLPSALASLNQDIPSLLQHRVI